MTQHNPVQICKHCGAIDTPTLSAGTGPHTVKASYAHCGGFIKWLSVLAPAERLARKLHSRLRAMQTYPPTERQLEYLRAPGDTLEAPGNMAEASERIETLVKTLPRQSTGARDTAAHQHSEAKEIR